MTCTETARREAARRSELVRRRAVERDDALELRLATGQRAGLVEAARSARRPGARSTPPPLTITPLRAARATPEISAIGAARISGHGVATTSTATARTGSPDDRPADGGQGERRAEHDDRVAVGHADERRALRLGAAHEADDPGIRALAGGPVGAQLERRSGVGRRRCARHRRARARPAAARRSTPPRRRPPARPASVPSTGTTSPGRTSTTSPTTSASTGTTSNPPLAAVCAHRSARAPAAWSARGGRGGSRTPPARCRPRASRPRRPRRGTRRAASAPAIAISAMRSTPRSPCSSDRADAHGERHEHDSDGRRPRGVSGTAGAGEVETAANREPGRRDRQRNRRTPAEHLDRTQHRAARLSPRQRPARAARCGRP